MYLCAALLRLGKAAWLVISGGTPDLSFLVFRLNAPGTYFSVVFAGFAVLFTSAAGGATK